MMTTDDEVPFELLFERVLNEEETDETPKDWTALRTTLIVYGSIFGVFSILFCILRQHFPLVYNVRNSVARLHCELCEQTYGLVNWTWKIMAVPDDEIFEQCSMDALCLIRLFRMGTRISLVGCFCSLFLLPLYITGDNPAVVLLDEYNETLPVDPWIRTTSSNLPAGSNRYAATAVAAYLLFGSSMFFLWKEFKWFTATRARFLSERQPRNFTVYVSGIPAKRRGDAALAAYFRRIFSEDAVLEAYIVLNIPKLEAKVKERQQMQLKLEHALALRDVKGIAVPMHTIVAEKKVVKRVPAIEFYQEKVRILDTKIKALKTIIEKRRKVADMAFVGRLGSISILHTPPSPTPKNQEEVEELNVSAEPILKDDKEEEMCSRDSESEEGGISGYFSAEYPPNDEDENLHVSESEHECSSFDDTGVAASVAAELHEEEGSSMVTPVRYTNVDQRRVSSHPRSPGLSRAARGGLSKATKLVGNKVEYEGKALSAGFVTFTKLSTVSAALQMVHTADPTGMRVAEPPQPEAIIWANVALHPSSRQTRQLLSFATTATVCVFWTIPVAFLVSLTKPETLKANFPKIGAVLEKNPWLVGLLNQLGPLLIQIMNNVVLPEIMKVISRFEGAIGQSRLLASMMTKMAAFHIIQTFFIASIAGGLIEAFEDFQDVGDVFKFLAVTLPPQSEFFIALVLIDAVLENGLELLRTTALIKAGLRKYTGPRLTEKERSLPWMSCRPLSNPRDFLFAHIYATEALHYMVLFVYTVLAPIVAFVTLFAFLIMEVGNRHQFFYIYPTTPDSGGRIWMELVAVLLCCMPIAESILFVASGLREARIAFYMFIPLLVVTILFVIFIFVRYYSIFLHLPSEACAEADAKFVHDDCDFEFVKHKYRQPALLGDSDDENDDDESEGRP